MITAKILADSVSAFSAKRRLVTLDLTFPMFVQPQLLRHRAFSFSVQSTRAVPLKEQIRRVREEPCAPLRWGAAQRGMVAENVIDDATIQQARDAWEDAMLDAAAWAERFVELKVHQEVAARLLMPFQWCRMILSATEWNNFFALRIDPHAQAEIRLLAEAIRDAMAASTPKVLLSGEWHLPLVDDEDREWCEGLLNKLEKEPGPHTDSVFRAARSDVMCLISAGRCARVSFLQHDGTRKPARDLELGKRLVQEGHMSPTEHQAAPLADHNERSGNFVGFKQHRKIYEHEDNRAAWLAAREP